MPYRNHLLSLSHLTALELSPPQLVAAAQAAGFDAVGIRINPGFPEDPQHPMLGYTKLAYETRDRVRDSGLQVLDVEILRLKPEMDFAAIEHMLELGAWLGARQVLVLGNDPDEARSTDHFGKVCEIAGRQGLIASLEFVFFNHVRTLEQAARMVNAVGSPHGQVLVDALHFFRAGELPTHLDAHDPSLFGYAQWCDAVAETPPLERLQIESRTNRLFPGEGSLPLAELLSHLPAGIPLAVEAPNEAMARTVDGFERIRLAMQAARRMLDAADLAN